MVANDTWLDIWNYAQQDGYSCGYVAALSVVHYYDPNVSAREVRRVVRPNPNWGVDRHKLVKALVKLGVDAELRTDLTIDVLREYVERGIPVIVSVWPEDWYSDHWTVVQGFRGDSVYLTNHWKLPVKYFLQEWSDMDMRGRGGSSEGIVCYPPAS